MSLNESEFARAIYAELHSDGRLTSRFSFDADP